MQWFWWTSSDNKSYNEYYKNKEKDKMEYRKSIAPIAHCKCIIRNYDIFCSIFIRLFEQLFSSLLFHRLQTVLPDIIFSTRIANFLQKWSGNKDCNSMNDFDRAGSDKLTY